MNDEQLKRAEAVSLREPEEPHCCECCGDEMDSEYPDKTWCHPCEVEGAKEQATDWAIDEAKEKRRG